MTDERVVRTLIDENPWATIVSHNDGEIVASHYPILLDDQADELTIVTHVGRPDERLHGLGSGEVLVIVAGPQGYISPSWYSEHDRPVPTWNFSVAHCYGTPEILGPEENLRVLTRMVDHFERHVDQPVALDQEFGARLARGTVGIRLQITRFVCKIKMSQDKDEQSRAQIVEALRRPGPYRNPAVADGVQRALRPDAAPGGAVQDATEALFSYGTLQQADVQQHTFGRLVAGQGDELAGHRLTHVQITDETVVSRSGSSRHPIVVVSDDPADSVPGTVLLLTAAELAASDAYEVDDYVRSRVTLVSGTRAWAYLGTPCT